LLGRLDKRERRILASRYGIGGGPEQTLIQIGRDLGISKERVRQLVARAQAKLRDSPASRRSSHRRSDIGQMFPSTATDRTTLLQPN
jgi:DNA-directed RNA polymerase sigma subunit (sigma70/sigma32)